MTSRLCSCCHVGAGCALRSGPRRQASPEHAASLDSVEDTVLSKSGRPSFTSRLCDCCNVGAGCVRFTRRHCEFDVRQWHIDVLLHDALVDPLHMRHWQVELRVLTHTAAQRAARARPLCLNGHTRRQHPMSNRHASTIDIVRTNTTPLSLSLLSLSLSSPSLSLSPSLHRSVSLPSLSFLWM